MPVTEDTKPNDNLGGFTNYKQKYSSMKTKLKAILYENELFQDELRTLQRELLDIYRDKETLLERVIQYEDIDSSSSDSESLSSDNECEIESTRNKPEIAPITNNSKQKTVTATKKRNATPSLNVSAAKRNNNSYNSNETGTKSATNGSPSSIVVATTPNNIKLETNVSMTDSKPTNGGNATPSKNNAAVGVSPSTVAKTKAPSRNRSKTAAGAVKNTSKTNNSTGSTKTNTVKNQKPAATNSGTTKTTNVKNQKKANNNNNNNNSTINNSNNNVTQQQSVTVINNVPTTSNQPNLCLQVSGIDSSINNNLVPSIQTIVGQQDHNQNHISDHFQQQQQQHQMIHQNQIIQQHQMIQQNQMMTQHQMVHQHQIIHPHQMIHQHQLIQPHQIHHQQPHHLQDPPTTIGIDSSHQQPIMTTQSNHTFNQQGYTIVSTNDTGNLMHSQQQQQQGEQLSQVVAINQAPQRIHIMSPQQCQHHQSQPTHTTPHQIVATNGHLIRQQTQALEQELNVNSNQIAITHDCSRPQDVLDALNNPGQQQQQLHQHHVDTSQQQQQQQQSSTNHISSEQNQQDLNNQQQNNNTFSTHQMTTEQLSAEELEQHLESRRMEQAALLLPDWESSVPSEIFSTDSAIKFMAED